jgi:hypothetical protein
MKTIKDAVIEFKGEFPSDLIWNEGWTFHFIDHVRQCEFQYQRETVCTYKDVNTYVDLLASNMGRATQSYAEYKKVFQESEVIINEVNMKYKAEYKAEYKGKVYQIGAAYEFSQTKCFLECSVEHLIAIDFSAECLAFKYINKDHVHAFNYCRVIGGVGAITDAPTTLEHGMGYQFTNIEDNTIHGIYDEDEHSFRGTCVEWSASTCNNIQPLTVKDA